MLFDINVRQRLTHEVDQVGLNGFWFCSSPVVGKSLQLNVLEPGDGVGHFFRQEFSERIGNLERRDGPSPQQTAIHVAGIRRETPNKGAKDQSREALNRPNRQAGSLGR